MTKYSNQDFDKQQAAKWQGQTTYATLLSGVWNDDGRFDDIKQVAVGDAAVLRVAQLALNGWKFCGADDVSIELERDRCAVFVNRISGDVCLYQF